MVVSFESFVMETSPRLRAGLVAAYGTETSARRSRRQHGYLPVPDEVDFPDFEPRLLPSLDLLSQSQRTAVLLVHAFAWPQTEAAELMGISVSSLRTHLARGVSKLQELLEVEPHVGS